MSKLSRKNGTTRPNQSPTFFFFLGGEKVVNSHSSSCYHSAALTPLQEAKGKNAGDGDGEDAVATLLPGPPLTRDGLHFFDANWRLAAAPPCEMTPCTALFGANSGPAPSPLHPPEGLEILPLEHQPPRTKAYVAHPRGKQTCSFLPAIL